MPDPVREAAPIAARLAATQCSGAGSDHRCDWYHGMWPYFHLLGVHGIHRDHQVQIVAQLERLANAGARRVLVSGAADYLLPSLVHAGHELAGVPIECTVLDRCPTPLSLCRWYAERQGFSLTTWCEDVVNVAGRPCFDVVIAHSFLPFFPPEQRSALFDVWGSLLAPGGHLVLAQRIRDRGPSRQQFSLDEIERLEARVFTAASGRCGLDAAPADLARLARQFAEAQCVYAVRSGEVETLLGSAGLTVVSKVALTADLPSSRPALAGTVVGAAHSLFIARSG